MIFLCEHTPAKQKHLTKDNLDGVVKIKGAGQSTKATKQNKTNRKKKENQIKLIYSVNDDWFHAKKISIKNHMNNQRASLECMLCYDSLKRNAKHNTTEHNFKFIMPHTPSDWTVVDCCVLPSLTK